MTQDLFSFSVSHKAPAVASRCADIAVPLPLDNTFSYLVPDELAPFLKSGMRVWVPLKNREIIGYVIAVRERREDETKLKPILKSLDPEPVLNASMLELTQWIAGYYGCSWGEAIENALPKWVKYGKKAEKALSKEVSHKSDPMIPQKDLTLTPPQQAVLDEIRQSLEQKNPKPLLIHGVTGSGKSEIYIRSIREVLAQGKSSICLVPEIALTEQIRRFFYHHFGNQLEILHSKLTDQERFLAWKRLERGEKRVVLGPRSAVFAPVKNLGLIIMDEEHEGTYKQETTPRYHAREVAAWRSHNENAFFMMGTATPSLETMYQTEKGKVRLIELKDRVDKKSMPPVTILDLKSIQQDRRKAMILSPMLFEEINKNLQKGEGTMLLLNRRGFSTFIHCSKCSIVESCPSCQVSLIFHQDEDILLCHYCNYRKPVPDKCPQCHVPNLRFAGFGTEKVESEVAMRFPSARIARMDADSVKKRGSHEEILKNFREKNVDILIGTQMIAKGFDFPHVTLVGVILADVGLMLPDFRSAERTFQLLTQVAGRAGRGPVAGRVFVQTFSPDHPSVRSAQNHDFVRFYQNELPSRREFRYPPFFRLINLIIRSKNENSAYVFGRSLREVLQQELKLPSLKPGEPLDHLELMGPAPLPFYKLRGQFRWHLMLKFLPDQDPVHSVKAALAKVKKPADVQYAVDVDPLNIL